ncbi:MAG TPA: Flp pilus assembly protein CpaB [Caulobacteraceae bacterium]|nr:Flp pilus assembly protein CpaB [Caulobacteraceae bacterium]
MRNIAIGLLIVALVLGAAAVWGVRSLAAGAEKGVQADALVVAARPIAFGETLTPDLLKLQPWPKGARPEGSFPTVAELTGPTPRVALRPIAANEPILASRVSVPGGRATLSALIEAGMRAVTIRVDDVFGVAGFVLPGDFVDVILTRPEGEATVANDNMRTDVLLQSVRVLAVDQLASENKDEPVVAKAATIEVTPEQAQKLALAAQVGTLSLALRGKVDPTASRAGMIAVRVDDLRLDGAPAAAAPARAASVSAPRPPAVRRPRPAAPAAAPEAHTIEIVRAGQSSQVRVGRD